MIPCKNLGDSKLCSIIDMELFVAKNNQRLLRDMRKYLKAMDFPSILLTMVCGAGQIYQN